MPFSNGFSFLRLRAESAPKPFVSKKTMEFDDFQSCITLPRDRSGARSVSKTCSKITFPKRENQYFSSFFFVFGLAAPRINKNAAKMASEVLPERLQGSPGDPAGAQNRSTSRLRPARGARQVIFVISGGLPGSPGAEFPPPGRNSRPRDPSPAPMSRPGAEFPPWSWEPGEGAWGGGGVQRASRSGPRRPKKASKKHQRRDPRSPCKYLRALLCN